MKPSLLVLAAGMGSRYGGIKQIESVGINGEILLDYAVYDANEAGFNKIVFVIRKDIEKDFRERFFNRIAKKCNAEYTFQSLNSFLSEKQIEESKDRTKPWGTAHAIICAKDKLNSPFAIINADDYYGRNAYKIISSHLSNITNDSSEYAMVGYTLNKTLSKSGSVSRGIYKTDQNYLTGINENKNISYYDGKIISKKENDTEIEFTGNETVSMNLFGFTPKVISFLEEYFNEFISKNIKSEKAECLIPDAIDLIIKTKQGKIKVYNTSEQWFGMTYSEDREMVRNALIQKTKEKYYPEILWK